MKKREAELTYIRNRVTSLKGEFLERIFIILTVEELQTRSLCKLDEYFLPEPEGNPRKH